MTTMVRGEEELFARTAHLFATASEITCAARTLATWAATHRADTAPLAEQPRVRKLYRPGMLLEASSAQHVRTVAAKHGAAVRITTDDINETIILDRRFVIMAGDVVDGIRTYGVVTEPALVAGVSSLYEAAWRSATPLEVYDAQHAGLAELAPRCCRCRRRAARTRRPRGRWASGCGPTGDAWPR